MHNFLNVHLICQLLVSVLKDRMVVCNVLTKENIRDVLVFWKVTRQR